MAIKYGKTDLGQFSVDFMLVWTRALIPHQIFWLYGSTCSQGNIARNLVDFNLVVERRTAKAPNFPVVQNIIIHTVLNLMEHMMKKTILKNAQFS